MVLFLTLFSVSLLLQDTEVVNTAILTGRRVAVPIKVVTVETDGQVREVDDAVTCSSTDADVVKVRCKHGEITLIGIVIHHVFIFSHLVFNRV